MARRAQIDVSVRLELILLGLLSYSSFFDTLNYAIKELSERSRSHSLPQSSLLMLTERSLGLSYLDLGFPPRWNQQHQ